MHLINNQGSVEDIKCSLGYMKFKSHKELLGDLFLLEESLKDEKMFRNRITVIVMIEKKIKSLNNQAKTWIR